MYARQIEDTTFTFGISGKLIMSAMVMYDHQTDSLWAHFTGDAIDGPMAGTVLEIVPAIQTSWGRWKGLHPDSVVLDENLGFQWDPYSTYYGIDWAGSGETRRDSRLDRKDYVVGLLLDGQAKAYGFAQLQDHPVVNDTVAGRDVLVTFDPQSASGGVFRLKVGGQTLTFSLLESTASESPLMVDEETGTRWLPLSGEAVKGPLKGTSLESIHTNYSFWFAWKDYYPETEVFLIDGA